MTDMVANDFLIYEVQSRQLISSNTVSGDLPSPLLAGNGYAWLTVWQNGFANDRLAIDNSGAGLLPFVAIPEPTLVSFFLVGIGGFACALRRRRMSA